MKIFTIADEEGHSRVYGPGDAFVMPKGFKGTWRQLSPIKKIAVAYTEDVPAQSSVERQSPVD